MIRISLPALCAILSMLLPVAPAAQGKGNGKGKNKAAHSSTAMGAGEVFSSAERALISEYIRGLPPSGLPPGLAKRGGDLPPGLEKQLRRNGRLPPGLEKRLYPFPPQIESRLGPLCEGCQRGFLNGSVVILRPGLSIVLDAFVPF